MIPDDLIERFNKGLAAQDWSSRTYAQYPKCCHLLLWDMEVERVLDDIVSWIKAPDIPLPSGLGRPLGWLVFPAPLKAVSERIIWIFPAFCSTWGVPFSSGSRAGRWRRRCPDLAHTSLGHPSCQRRAPSSAR